MHENGPVELSAKMSHTFENTWNAWAILFDNDDPYVWNAQLTETMNAINIDKKFHLDAGRHTLHIDMREPNTRMQSITITSGQASFIGVHTGLALVNVISA